jgi:hypothetical protein
MKITTEHCVYAICKHFYLSGESNPLLLRAKLWKRLSKKGSGDNVVREFQNSETGTVVIVYSSESYIFDVKEVKTPPTLTTIKEYLRVKSSEVEDPYYDLDYEALGPDNVVNWPIVKIEDEDFQEEEPLDMENFEWLSITDDELVICCGGDWQEPQTLTIKVVNGKLTVTNTIPGEYRNGLNEEQFKLALQ